MHGYGDDGYGIFLINDALHYLQRKIWWNFDVEMEFVYKVSCIISGKSLANFVNNFPS